MRLIFVVNIKVIQTFLSIVIIKVTCKKEMYICILSSTIYKLQCCQILSYLSIDQSFWNSSDLSDLGGRKSWGPPIRLVMPVPTSPNIFEWCVYFFNVSRKRRSYCKYRNKFGQLGIRNRIEYVIFYLFLVNIIGNCHENKYIWIYCDA